ncbi:beta-lactamase class D [Devosia enhydra]|uniref:beta-lactamase n=1 Tax=Devosia enhydra TaxID=665118 RepID=A0A1K2I2C4_9HYPH|nr:class D beta-lactamase [Devosia enhydra]SFZ85900.1 beta-lactamase class D [Devosia enhydra]
MKPALLLTALVLVVTIAAGLPARAATLCTLVADARSGVIRHQSGTCDEPVTPASTFKIALAVLGFEAGILTADDAPVMTIRPGEPDWGGPAWHRPVDPRAWMTHSVVWYSQRIAASLGAQRLEAGARRLGYGNADFAGDPGKDNGLQRAWISSSLLISPREQVAFLAALATDALPVDRASMALARSIVETNAAGGWTLHGKTGSAYPRRADGSLDRARGWGWYVGWAERDGQLLTFARLAQDERRESVSGGLRARESLIVDWVGLVR